MRGSVAAEVWLTTQACWEHLRRLKEVPFQERRLGVRVPHPALLNVDTGYQAQPSELKNALGFIH